jgi:hypothetical protein
MLDFMCETDIVSRMDAYNQLKCMKDKGIITDAQFDLLAGLINSLPTSNGDLLQVIAAASLVSLDGSGNFAGIPIGTESLMSTDATDVKSLTVPTGATRAVVSVHGNNIIFRTDGGAPAANTGHFGELGSNFIVGSLSDFKFVSQSTTDAYIFVSYY